MTIRIFILLILTLAMLFAAEEKQSKIASSPAYDKMKTLAGSWEGAANEGGKQVPANARFQLVAGSSVRWPVGWPKAHRMKWSRCFIWMATI